MMMQSDANGLSGLRMDSTRASAWSIRVVLLAVVVVLATYFGTGTAWACPTCKDTLASATGEGANLARGYFWSIMFMVSMPFVILAGLATYFYLEVRRARGRVPLAAANTMQPNSTQPNTMYRRPTAGGAGFAGTGLNTGPSST